jgi:hypothetical protein
VFESQITKIDDMTFQTIPQSVLHLNKNLNFTHEIKSGMAIDSSTNLRLNTSSHAKS